MNEQILEDKLKQTFTAMEARQMWQEETKEKILNSGISLGSKVKYIGDRIKRGKETYKWPFNFIRKGHNDTKYSDIGVVIHCFEHSAPFHFVAEFQTESKETFRSYVTIEEIIGV